MPIERSFPGESAVSLIGQARPPRPLTSLVGRDQEIRRLVSLLRSGTTRLLTLTGSGGVGKTRLAIATLDALADDDAVATAFISLADIHAPELVSATVGSALGVPRLPMQAWDEALIYSLQQDRFLLVLDNFEHLLSAGPFLSQLLQRCPSLQLLVTSRSPLRIGGEVIFRVEPLAVSETITGSIVFEELGEREAAIQLLVDRVTGAAPGFTVSPGNIAEIHAICQRLDGLPLAIELAATRLSSMTPATLLARLDRRLPMLTGGMRDAPDRHQTMQQTIAWSYDLLHPDQQQLFALLSVFTGGASLDAIEFVAECIGIDADSVPDLLSALIEQSLIEQSPPDSSGGSRYWMLETIREFAGSVLQAAGDETAAQTAHAEWVRRYVETAEVRILTGAGRFAPTLRSVKAELPNIRGAIARATETGDVTPALAIAASFGLFWALIERYREGSDTLARIVALDGADQAPPAALAKGLASLSQLLSYQGRFDESLAACSRALALVELVDDADTVAYVHKARAYHGFLSEDAVAAETHGQIAADIFLTRGTAELAYQGIYALARAASITGQHELAHERFAEMLRLGYAQNHEWLLASTLEFLAVLEQSRGNHAAARDYREQALPYVREVAEAWTLTMHLQGIATSLAEDDPARSATILASIDAFRRAIHFPGLPADKMAVEQALATIKQRLDPGRFTAAWSAGSAMSLEEAIELLQRDPSPDARSPPSARQLTRREIEVLRLVAAGASDKEIAAALSISRKTASKHVSSILAKLDVHSRTGAATLALREKLLDAGA